MHVPLKCTIVRAIGRTVYRLEIIKELAVGTETTLSAILKRKDCIPYPLSFL